MPVITLREITRELFKPCIRLSVREDQQRFVASNVYSLAQAKTNPKLFPFAIYGEEVVGRNATPEDQMRGFVMYQVWDGIGFVMRLMVDHAHQGQGYGTAAILEVTRRLKLMPEVERIATSVHEDNPRVLELYQRLGFTELVEHRNHEFYLRLDWRP